MACNTGGKSMSQAIEEIQETIRNAFAARAPLSIKGRGTWIGAYKHVSAAKDLPLWNYAGVQEYVPGNLTMTVRAGTTLAEIAEIAAAENQWLPLDPFGSNAGTIGATIATCSYGPLVTGFGTPRDLVLGVEAVLGTGDIVRGGGRVVKNVAGYDLSRLLTGSWGALGAITEVTLRLFAKQESEISMIVPLPAKRETAQRMINAIRSGPVFPWAMELLDAKFANALGLTSADESVLVLRFGGNQNLVQSQASNLPTAGAGSRISDDFWKSLAEFQHAWSMRISGLPSRLFDTWDAAASLVASVGAGYRMASPERGTCRLFFPDNVDSGKLFTALGQFSAANHGRSRIVIEAMPSISPLSFSDRGTTHKDLAAGIKGVFDPNNILNPGLLPQ
jgi:glycolate oxidase FAD binding subunit